MLQLLNIHPRNVILKLKSRNSKFWSSHCKWYTVSHFNKAASVDIRRQLQINANRHVILLSNQNWKYCRFKSIATYPELTFLYVGTCVVLRLLNIHPRNVKLKSNSRNSKFWSSHCKRYTVSHFDKAAIDDIRRQLQINANSRVILFSDQNWKIL